MSCSGGGVARVPFSGRLGGSGAVWWGGQTIAITQTLRKAEKELKLVVAGGGDASDEKVRGPLPLVAAPVW